LRKKLRFCFFPPLISSSFLPHSVLHPQFVTRAPNDDWTEWLASRRDHWANEKNKYKFLMKICCFSNLYT
jgi:hypothetical protein